MDASGISKSQAGRPCQEIDERVADFRSRSLKGDWPCLRLDATCPKSRADRRT